MPDELSVEAWQLSPDTLELLEKMGHKIKRTGSWGDAECIAIDKNGERLGASDGRNGGSAVGWSEKAEQTNAEGDFNAGTCKGAASPWNSGENGRRWSRGN
jgi:hypothetical protein